MQLQQRNAYYTWECYSKISASKAKLAFLSSEYVLFYFFFKKPPNNYLTRFPAEFRVFYTFHSLTYNPTTTHFHLAEIFPQGVCTWRHKTPMQLKRLRNNLLKNLGAVGGKEKKKEKKRGKKSSEKVISRTHNSNNWFAWHIFNLFKVLHIIAPWRNS